jgi:hydroxylamine dehydrogenase
MFMKFLRPVSIALFVALIAGLPAGRLAAEEKPQSASGEQEQLKELYDNPTLKKWFEEPVGLEKGSGPWMDVYKPVPMHMYWYPNRHYVKPDGTYYDQLLQKYKAEDCVKCHEEVTPGIVNDWRESTHAHPKKDEGFAAKTKDIEKRLNREVAEVSCNECHGKDHKELKMPSWNTCGQCHTTQTNQFLSEKDYGRPNHPQTTEANVIVPWYPELYRMGIGNMQFGCDYCHAASEKCDICHTRHAFKAAEGRRPEACQSCHMGFDHPDAESYGESKMGYIYHMEGHHWDFEKPLKDVVPGKDYRSPTCQFCHMYTGKGEFSHNVVSKGIWRMGTVPPKGMEFKSSLKDYPYGVNLPPLNYKLDIYSPESKAKREKWIEACSNCHSPRWARLYLENLDEVMFQVWGCQDRSQKCIEDVIAAGALDPGPEDRDPYPLGDLVADALGPGLLGEPIYNAFKQTKGKIPVLGPILGVYADFYPGKYNPSRIERLYVDMWFGDKAFLYKGTAHVQQDISWWYGSSKVFGKMAEIESEARMLMRSKDVDRMLKEKGRYKSLPMLGLILAGIVGGVFGVGVIRRRKGN